MKFLSDFVPLGILAAATVSSFPITRREWTDAPLYTGTGDCDGAVNGANSQPIKVPCDCPPDRATFIKDLNANVAAGHVLNNSVVPISFPEDNSTASQLARLNAASVTLQNLNGPGEGCPVASTTFQAQAAAINKAGTQPAPPTNPSPSSSSQAPTSNDAGTPTALSASSTPSVTPVISNAGSPIVPSASSGSSSGTGNCDGAINGGDGKPIQVPCGCPPDQATFNQHLLADVTAGHAVNNPTVKVSFPLDNSVASQLARVDTALVTLQNLNGPGKGCPAVSTTLTLQQAGLVKQL
ncbi:hypothetical protein F5888DRAFT_1796140 [Russula emetica]|nr:hypothetical protein F5888DRAFT_1796140 [Russula emetica]